MQFTLFRTLWFVTNLHEDTIAANANNAVELRKVEGSHHLPGMSPVLGLWNGSRTKRIDVTAKTMGKILCRFMENHPHLHAQPFTVMLTPAASNRGLISAS
jgi:hypothetical protein